MKIGDKVIYTENGWKYLAIIVAKEENGTNVKVSVSTFSKVITVDISNLEAI